MGLPGPGESLLREGLSGADCEGTARHVGRSEEAQRHSCAGAGGGPAKRPGAPVEAPGPDAGAETQVRPEAQGELGRYAANYENFVLVAIEAESLEMKIW